MAGFFKEDLRSLLFSDSDESNKFAELNILLMSTFNPYLKRHPSGCAQASVSIIKIIFKFKIVIVFTEMYDFRLLMPLFLVSKMVIIQQYPMRLILGL